MAINYTVGKGREFTYPADAKSLEIVKSAGGVSKLSETEKLVVKYKVVIEGQDCSDMPADVREIYVSRGWIDVIDSDKTVPTVVVTESVPVTPSNPTAPVVENK